MGGCGGTEPTSEEARFNIGSDNFAPPLPPDCVTDDPCVVSAMGNSGECDIVPIPGCAMCTTKTGANGTSRDGAPVCCAGCWAGSTCRPEPDWAACGIGGSLCSPCKGGEDCLPDGTCGYP